MRNLSFDERCSLAGLKMRKLRGVSPREYFAKIAALEIDAILDHL